MVEAAIKWFKQANYDLTMAERNIEIEGYAVSAFLAHQAVEKLLKGILIVRGLPVPRTHQIEVLVSELDLKRSFKERIVELSEDYTQTRYPDAAVGFSFDEYTEEVAREKIALAKEVFDAFEDVYQPLLEESDDESDERSVD
ncbi:MAG: HEPN domain-containing protein [Candidatus Poribacteria bacterium]|nr:HEPN domain-containing protein [Candidatus Poribacteria bacterium]